MPIARRLALRGSLGAIRVACLAAAAGVSAPVLAADPSAADKETSRGLYREGMRLFDAHDYAGAERACRGAHALVQAPTSATCWARALESLGRLIEARDAFLEAVRYPAAPGEPPVFTAARESARTEADALAARIPTMVLVVSGVSDGAAVTATVDGAPMAPDTVRLPRKVDPGRHVVVVQAPGAAPVRLEVNAPEGRTEQVPVALVVASGADGSPAPSASLTLDGATAPAERPSRWPAYMAFGVGGVGLGVGLATALAAGSKDGTLASECRGNVCPPSARGDLDAFHSLSTVSTVAYVVGAAGVLGGGALWLFGPHASGLGSTAARVWVGPGSGGVAGTF
jgi:hypothetical protein